MARVLIIGAGGVGRVATHKCAQYPEIFSEIMLASRTVSKCEKIASEIERPIRTAQVDADYPEQVQALIKDFKPDIVINVALPYQNMAIMEACLREGVHYVDTAAYEPKDEKSFSYDWQLKAYKEPYRGQGLVGLLGCGFDPGVTNVYVAYAAKHYFDEIHELEIVDVNAGDHGLPFATNFNPEVNIREITLPARHWEGGEFKVTPPLSEKRDFECPEGLGTYPVYLMYHEELETLVRNFPTIKKATFWMKFSDEYLQTLRTLQRIGMTSIEPVDLGPVKISPLDFLRKVLPDPAELGPRTKGKTCIGNIMTGIKDGKKRRIFIYNICDHQEAYKETGAQAVSYTAGVPPVLGAALVLDGAWKKPGVYTPEEFDPDPFMERIGEYGLPWKVVELDPEA
ncbi:saccharopine dehydrogenase family protein [Spirochaeta thermophila]|uniref:Putative saccharopine dehydrogenase n=1 Tax=Winmispira thermophila (strain ATCC 49972 / DSM 6192 / RI 19.B1) TaxID=665571 RepID=E0RP77_WINT6|nr:saccharopine dehydrogenase family protein [Spirochaeta thermophila]ADN01271.1 putative saccharopine dehydrogenase [Spirochaeta thermophila DSM 6192]